MKKLEKMFKEAGLYSLDSPWIIEATDERVFAVVKAYAQSAIDEIKEEIANKAKCIKSGNSGSWYDASIDKESIRSVTIELK